MVVRRQVALQPPPPLGYAVPYNIRHAISVQVTTWEDMKGLPLRSERIEKAQKGGYPRSYFHADVVQVQSKRSRSSRKGSQDQQKTNLGYI
jgi:hypothetical protein